MIPNDKQTDIRVALDPAHVAEASFYELKIIQFIFFGTHLNQVA